MKVSIADFPATSAAYPRYAPTRRVFCPVQARARRGQVSFEGKRRNKNTCELVSTVSRSETFPNSTFQTTFFAAISMSILMIKGHFYG